MTLGLRELPVAYRDVGAADLALHLGLAPQDALIVHTVERHGWSVELRILGASHQVLLERDGVAVCSETVACLEGGRRPAESLPVEDRRHIGSAEYAFDSLTSRPDPARFCATVETMTSDLAGDPLAVCGAFPGDPLATTGVQVRLDEHHRDVAAWRTWHTYPQTGEVVLTSTRVTVR